MVHASRNDTLGFAERTRKNLEFIDAGAARGCDVHPVTQLVNSLLGLLVFPYEKAFFETIKKWKLEVLAARGWPCPDIFQGRCETLEDFLINLRNGVSHGRIRFSSDSRDPAQVEIVIENLPSRKSPGGFGVRLAATDLRALCDCIIRVRPLPLGGARPKAAQSLSSRACHISAHEDGRVYIMARKVGETNGGTGYRIESVKPVGWGRECQQSYCVEMQRRRADLNSVPRSAWKVIAVSIVLVIAVGATLLVGVGMFASTPDPPPKPLTIQRGTDVRTIDSPPLPCGKTPEDLRRFQQHASITKTAVWLFKPGMKLTAVTPGPEATEVAFNRSDFNGLLMAEAPPRRGTGHDTVTCFVETSKITLVRPSDHEEASSSSARRVAPTSDRLHGPHFLSEATICAPTKDALDDVVTAARDGTRAMAAAVIASGSAVLDPGTQFTVVDPGLIRTKIPVHSTASYCWVLSEYAR